MSKTHIVIATTSLNRPILHNDIFPDWINWINKANSEKYTITWFINIDIIEKLQVSYEETKENYEKLANGLIEIKFFKCEGETGNFLKACKRLSSEIKQFVENSDSNESSTHNDTSSASNMSNISNTKIIWLEDDWKLNPDKILNINELLDNYSGNLTHINLTFIRANYIHALAPSIVSYDLWKQLHCAAWEKQTNNIDPEHCVGLYYVKNFCKYSNTNNVTIANRQVDINFLNQKYMNDVNSFYSYNQDKYILEDNNERYVKKEDLKLKFNNLVTFIRISPTVCVDGCDYGRKFMEKYQIEKNKGVYGENFYNCA